jgi:hypothetical protein
MPLARRTLLRPSTSAVRGGFAGAAVPYRAQPARALLGGQLAPPELDAIRQFERFNIVGVEPA